MFSCVNVSLRNSKYTITISQFVSKAKHCPGAPSKMLKSGGVEYMKVHCLALCQTTSAIGTSKRLVFGLFKQAIPLMQCSRLCVQHGIYCLDSGSCKLDIALQFRICWQSLLSLCGLQNHFYYRLKKATPTIERCDLCQSSSAYVIFFFGRFLENFRRTKVLTNNRKSSEQTALRFVYVAVICTRLSPLMLQISGPRCLPQPLASF